MNHRFPPARFFPRAALALRTWTVLSLALAAFASAAPAQTASSSLVFATLAGRANRGAVDGPGAAAQFNNPLGLAIDSGGDIVVADGNSNTIRSVTPAGLVTTRYGLAGAPIASIDGSGSAARFGFPAAVAVDGAGNIYVTDVFVGAIRKITPGGTVTTLAGPSGALDVANHGSADGTGSAARFDFPVGIAVDSAGEVYVAEQNNHTIRKITPAGVVSTLAGAAGNSGSADGTGAAARFNGPGFLALDAAGNLYVADAGNSTIRKVTPAGVVTTLAGSPGLTGSANGTGSAARFDELNGLVADGLGNLFVCDANNRAIRKITPAGVVTVFAGSIGNYGTADGTGTAALFKNPIGIALDRAGNLYVSDGDDATIRRITPAAVVTTIAGQNQGFSIGSADGIGSAARFSYPAKVAVDGAGNVYVADADNDTVRRITPAGVVTTLAGQAGSDGGADGTGAAARFGFIRGITVDAAGNVFVADFSRIRKITPAGVVTSFAGGATGSLDATGAAARFSGPMGEIAIDSDGSLYVADTDNHTVRKITPAAVVTTLAGQSGSSGTVNGTGAAARFNAPVGIAVDAAKNVYVADDEGRLIRKITPAGVVTTLAGASEESLGADGSGSAARFGGVTGLAVDADGNVFAADYNDYTIRKITPAGVVTTVAGAVQVGATVDGPGSDARFGGPFGLAIDGAGNLYVADTEMNTIRKGTLTVAPVVTAQPSSQVASAGGSVGLTAGFSGSPTPAIQWSNNGADVSGATGATLTIDNLQPANVGIYQAGIANTNGTSTSNPVIVGVMTTSKVIGTGTELQPANIPHPNGNIFDQVLVTGTAETITADANQVTRTSFIDLNDDIVQLEFTGAGTLSVVLDNPTGPAVPVNYNQASVSYMKGHAGIVVTGANETTNLSIFSVGRLTAFDPTGGFNFLQAVSATNNPANNGSSLFVGHGATNYDGVADVAFIAISSTNGKFGGLRAAGASCFATKGLTGIYAPGVQFTGPVFISDITASDTATPVFIIGSATDTRITGGDLLQTNGQPVKVSGVTQLRFTAGGTSNNVALSAKTNQALLRQNGVDVTDQIVVNP